MQARRKSGSVSVWMASPKRQARASPILRALACRFGLAACSRPKLDQRRKSVRGGSYLLPPPQRNGRYGGEMVTVKGTSCITPKRKRGGEQRLGSRLGI